MKLVSIIMLSFFFIQGSLDTRLELEQFIFDQQELPEGCIIKPIAEGDRLPCQIKTNPFISADRDFLNCFSRSFVRDSVLASKVKSGLFSIYEDQWEIGVFGLETDSKKTAKLILDEMITNIPSQERGEIIQAGNLLIWLWHDRTKPSSFDELNQLIKAQIE